MAQTLVYVPVEKLQDATYRQRLRSWQKERGFAAERLRWTPDFLTEEQSLHQQQLTGALHMLREGKIAEVIYFEPRKGFEKNINWVAFALSCQELGVSLKDGLGQPLLEQATLDGIKQLFAHENSH